MYINVDNKEHLCRTYNVDISEAHLDICRIAAHLNELFYVINIYKY